MLEIAVNRYRQVVASTSTPGELLLALYAGLFRNLRVSRKLLEDKKRAPATQLLSKCHAIVCELDMALEHDVFPELCQNLTAIYGFCLDRLLLAMRKGSPEAIDEVIRALTPLHEAWQVAVPQATREQGNRDRVQSR
ncbi:MAG TPA: flagellar export chaperone FliS [Polyangiaceae bacterium]|jgi:flagellar protein FliS